MAVQAGRSKLEKANMRTVADLGSDPTDRRDMIGHGTSDKGHFAKRKPVRFNACQDVVTHAGRSRQPAVDKHIAVMGRIVARLNQVSFIQRFQLTAVEVNHPGAPNKIDIALNVTVVDIEAAVKHENVLKAWKIRITYHTTIPVNSKRFSLRTALGRRVAQGNIF